MKMKRNSLTTLLAVSLLLMALSGCGQQAEPDSAQPPLETVTYSNLTDADSRKLLTEALADANVDETRTKLLLDCVDQFNASVKSEWLTGGFESAAPTETRYDPYEMQDLWMEKNGSFPGYNCRITAFSLFGEFVTAGADQPETQGEDSLFMDLETLAADPAVLCGDSTSKFCALFAPVTAADTTEVADQVKALQAGWSERGISFEDSSARLISVVLHDRFSDTDIRCSSGTWAYCCRQRTEACTSLKRSPSGAVPPGKDSEQNRTERLSDGKIRYRMGTGYDTSLHHGK